MKICGSSFLGGPCFVHKDATVSIYYYAWKIEVGKSSRSLVKEYKNEMDYQKLVNYLKEKGFTNIVLKRTDSLWNTSLHFHDEGSIESISIAGESEFSSDTTFYPRDKIEIVVYTIEGKGCEDITEVAK